MGGIIDLPPEVVVAIGRYCGQADTLNLGVALPPFAPYLVSLLYRSIVFDTGPRPLDGRRSWHYISDGRMVPDTIVRTVAGIRQCLRTLRLYSEHAADVWRLEVRSDVGLSDAMFITEVTAAFPNLRSLVVLEWTACPELPPSVLAMLPNPHLLETLRVDLAVRPWQQCQDHQTLPILGLNSLRHLDVRPFLDASVLEWLQSCVCDSCHLEDMSLSRTLAGKASIGSAYVFAAVEGGDSDYGTTGSGLNDDASARRDYTDSDLSIISRFLPLKHRLKLRRFGLIGTTTVPGDAVRLQANCDLSHLEFLELVGRDTSSVTNSGLLMPELGTLPNLKALTLDWEAPISVLEDFLREVGKQLDRLDLTIKWPQAMSLVRVASSLRSLRHLTLSITCPFKMADLTPLVALKQLEFLGMPFNFNVQSWQVVHELPSLRSLRLWNSAPSSHGGLLTGGTFSDWDDPERPPLQYMPVVSALRPHTSLQQLEIDGRPIYELGLHKR